MKFIKRFFDKSKFILDNEDKVSNCPINIIKMNWLEYMVFFMSIRWDIYLDDLRDIAINLIKLLLLVLTILTYPITFPIISIIVLKDRKKIILKNYPNILKDLEKEDGK